MIELLSETSWTKKPSLQKNLAQVPTKIVMMLDSQSFSALNDWCCECHTYYLIQEKDAMLAIKDLLWYPEHGTSEMTLH